MLRKKKMKVTAGTRERDNAVMCVAKWIRFLGQKLPAANTGENMNHHCFCYQDRRSRPVLQEKCSFPGNNLLGMAVGIPQSEVKSRSLRSSGALAGLGPREQAEISGERRAQVSLGGDQKQLGRGAHLRQGTSVCRCPAVQACPAGRGHAQILTAAHHPHVHKWSPHKYLSSGKSQGKCEYIS